MLLVSPCSHSFQNMCNGNCLTSLKGRGHVSSRTPPHGAFHAPLKSSHSGRPCQHASLIKMADRFLTLKWFEAATVLSSCFQTNISVKLQVCGRSTVIVTKQRNHRSQETKLAAGSHSRNSLCRISVIFAGWCQRFTLNKTDYIEQVNPLIFIQTTTTISNETKVVMVENRGKQSGFW